MGGKGSGPRAVGEVERKRQIIQMAWDIVAEVFANTRNPLRFQIAKDIVVKDVVTKVEGKGMGGDVKILVVENINALTKKMGEPALTKLPQENTSEQ